MVSLLFLPRRRRGYLSTSYLLVFVVLFHLIDTSNGAKCYKAFGELEVANLFTIAEASVIKSDCEGVCVMALCSSGAEKNFYWVQGCIEYVRAMCGNLPATYELNDFDIRIDKDNLNYAAYACEGDCRKGFFQNLIAKEPEKKAVNFRNVKWPIICINRTRIIDRQTLDVNEISTTAVTDSILCQHSCVSAICQKDELFWIDSCPTQVYEFCNIQDNKLKRDIGLGVDICLSSTVNMINAFACGQQDCRPKFLQCLNDISAADSYYDDLLRKNISEGLQYPGRVIYHTTTGGTPVSDVDHPCYKGSGEFANGEIFSIAETVLTNSTCRVVCVLAVCYSNSGTFHWFHGCSVDIPKLCGFNRVMFYVNKMYSYAENDIFKYAVYTCDGDCREGFFRQLMAEKPEKNATNLANVKWPVICNNRTTKIDEQTRDIGSAAFEVILENQSVACRHKCVSSICKTKEDLLWVDSCPTDVSSQCELQTEAVKNDIAGASHTCHLSNTDKIIATGSPRRDNRQNLLKCLEKSYSDSDPKNNNLRIAYPQGFVYDATKFTTTTPTAASTTTEKTTSTQSDASKSPKNPDDPKADPSKQIAFPGRQDPNAKPRRFILKEGQIYEENGQDTSDGNMKTPLNLFTSFIMIIVAYFFALW